MTHSYSIYKLHGDRLMSDIPDYIYELLANETDLATRRNAFAFLMDCKQSLAIEFLENNCDEVDFPPFSQVDQPLRRLFPTGRA